MPLGTDEITLANWRTLLNEARDGLVRWTAQYDRVKQARDDLIVKADAAGETQRDIAHDLGISQSTVSYVLVKKGRSEFKGKTSFRKYMNLIEHYNKFGSVEETARTFGVPESLVRHTIDHYKLSLTTGA